MKITYPCVQLSSILKFDHLNLFEYIFFEISVADTHMSIKISSWGIDIDNIWCGLVCMIKIIIKILILWNASNMEIIHILVKIIWNLLCIFTFANSVAAKLFPLSRIIILHRFVSHLLLIEMESIKLAVVLSLVESSWTWWLLWFPDQSFFTMKIMNDVIFFLVIEWLAITQIIIIDIAILLILSKMNSLPLWWITKLIVQIVSDSLAVVLFIIWIVLGPWQALITVVILGSVFCHYFLNFK